MRRDAGRTTPLLQSIDPDALNMANAPNFLERQVSDHESPSARDSTLSGWSQSVTTAPRSNRFERDTRKADTSLDHTPFAPNGQRYLKKRAEFWDSCVPFELPGTGTTTIAIRCPGGTILHPCTLPSSIFSFKAFFVFFLLAHVGPPSRQRISDLCG